MQFVAVLGGRVVSYPQSALFVIEKRKAHQPFSLVSTKDSIHSAITKFHRCAEPGTSTRLSYTQNGQLVPILKETHLVHGI